VSDRNPDDRIHVWEIEASHERTKGGESYFGNVRMFVIAKTMERAIAVFRTMYATASLHRVQRRDHIYGNDSVHIDGQVAHVVELS